MDSNLNVRYFFYQNMLYSIYTEEKPTKLCELITVKTGYTDNGYYVDIKNSLQLQCFELFNN